MITVFKFDFINIYKMERIFEIEELNISNLSRLVMEIIFYSSNDSNELKLTFIELESPVFQCFDAFSNEIKIIF